MPTTTVNDREMRGADLRVGISTQSVKDVIDTNPVFIPVRRTDGKTSKVVSYTEDPSVNGRMQAAEQIMDSEDLTAELNTVLSKQTINWMRAALHSDEVDESVTAIDIAATATGFTSTGGGFGGLVAGDGIWVSGFTNSAINGFYIVATAAAGEITTTIAPAATEAAGASVTVTCKRSWNADAPTYSAIQTRGTDLSKTGEINYHTLYNAVPNTFSFEIGETGIVTATTAFVAEMEVEGSDAISGQSYAAALTDRAVTSRRGASSCVQGFYVNGESATCSVKTLSLEVNNNYQKDDAAGCTPYYVRGQFQASGSVNVRSKISNPFAWRDYSWNGTRVAIAVRISHGNGDESYIVVRRAVVNDVTMPDGNNVVANSEANFTAEEDQGAGVTIAVYRNWV